MYGSVVDGQYYNAATNKPEGTTSDLPDQTVEIPFDPSLFAEPYAALWETFVVFQLGSGAAPGEPTIPPAPSPLPSWFGYGWDGQQAPTEGEVFYILAHNGDYKTSYKAAIDGLTITGGDQKGFPGNRNEVGGGRLTNAPGETGTAPDENFVLDIQGGAIMANAYARFLQITNNSVIANSGASGAIRIGTPQLGTDTEDGNPEGDPVTGETFPAYDQQNTDLRLAYNRITANGGTSLGGALALFNGSERYRVDHNEFCGNFSAEYGGAISHFGLSKNGVIDHNKIYLNESVDEGAGIMIGGEPHLDPATAIPLPDKLSNGSGAVSIHDNYIAANLAGDDGGGIRFLQSGNWPADVYNNMITNNVSTHEGGGIALDDATNVRIYNDTIAKNLTTATAVTSLGAPAPAGISTGDNSSNLMACSLASADVHPYSGPDHEQLGDVPVAGGRSGVEQLRRRRPWCNIGVAEHSRRRPDRLRGRQRPQCGAQRGRHGHITSYCVARADVLGVPRLQRHAAAGRLVAIQQPVAVQPRLRRQPGGQLAEHRHDPRRSRHRTGHRRDRQPLGHGSGRQSRSVEPDQLDHQRRHVGTSDQRQPDQPGGERCSGHQLPEVQDGNAHVTGWYDIKVSVSPWRVNPRFRPTAIVGVSLPANAIGDYHLDPTSPAINLGAASTNIAPFGLVTAPATDIDNDARPAPPDSGADEVKLPTADLTITKTHSPSGSVAFGAAVSYTVTVHNNGPDAVTGAHRHRQLPVTAERRRLGAARRQPGRRARPLVQATAEAAQ